MKIKINPVSSDSELITVEVEIKKIDREKIQ